MKRNILITTILLVAFVSVNAQQVIQPSQVRYIYDFNPATIGINENAALLNRQVFSGIDGAPTLQIFSVNKLIDNSMGLGLQVYNSSQGFVSNKGMKAGYMYRVGLNESNFLAFGISADVFQKKYSKDMYNLKQPNDPAFIDQSNEYTGIDFDFGVSFNTPNFYVDLAILQVPGRSVSLSNDFAESRRNRHYLLNAAYKIPLKNNFVIEPSILFKTTETFVFHIDGGLRCIWDETVWVGAMYRSNQMVVASAGVKLDRFAFGFAYDYGFSPLFDYSTGSWEMMFVYDLNRSKARKISN